MSAYVESQADHEFTAWLSSLTPGQVLKDREAMFSKSERKRKLFLRQKSAVELEVQRAREIREAVQLAGLMRTP